MRGGQNERIMQAADADARMDWNAPYKGGDNLRVLTPIAKFNLSRQVKAHLKAMPEERREQLEREWEESAVDIRHERISAEIKARADEEWRSCA